MTRRAELVPYDEALTRYEPVIGLETHVELGTATKMFCGCPARFGGEPNTFVCPVCLGLPGSLPVASRAAIEYTIRIGLALNCTIADWCRFARKNYFYPDMPKNFQISQYDEPLCVDGWLDIAVDEPGGGARQVRVGIERVHLEEDTGKSLHVGGATGRIHGADYSLVDYNRAGIALVEIVTRPIEGTGALAPDVARTYVTELRDLMRALGVSDVRMEEGSLRCDVNTSLSPRGSGRWGTRTETKNVNSLRSVERAVRFEIERQAAALDAGERIVQETRHFHEDSGTTTAGRSKEEAQDYRYFPEPDLVPVAPSREWVEQIRATLPELPAAWRARLMADWGLSDLDFAALRNAGAVDLVEQTVAAGASPADARKWWLGELARRANESGTDLADLPITPGDVARVSALVASGALNDKLARQVIEGVVAGEGTPDEVVAGRGLAIVSDEGALTAAVDEAIAANPDAAQKVRDGKVAAAGALVGAVMKATRGQADASRARSLFLERLLRRPVPFISRVRLKDYKSIAECDVPLGSLAVLVGLNGSGKSNFLDALAFLGQAVATTLGEAIAYRGGLTQIMRRVPEPADSLSIAIEFRIPGGADREREERGSYEVEIARSERSGDGSFEVLREECILDRPGGIERFEVDRGTVRASWLLNQESVAPDRLYLQEAGLPASFVQLSVGLRGMRFYNFDTETLRRPHAPATGVTLGPRGENLGDVVEAIERQGTPLKDRFDAYVRAVEPDLVGVERDLVDRYVTVRARTMSGLDDMSDGTLRFVAALAAVAQPSALHDRIPLVGIEEPEIALHPAAAGVLFDAFTEASQHVQVVVTSHSPDLLDRDDLDVSIVRVVSMERGMTVIGVVDEASRRVVRDKLHTVGDLMRRNQLFPG